MKHRTLHKVFIFGKIDETMSHHICEQLAKISLEADDHDMAIVIIKSNGGFAKSAYDITEAITNLHIPCITVGWKTVASAATIILAAGQTRFLTADTVMVHHNVKLHSYIKEGEYSPEALTHIAVDILAEVEKMKIEENKIWSLVTRDSLLTPQKIKEMLKKSKGQDLYFSAYQAKKLKLVHDVIPDLQALTKYLIKK